MTEAKEMQGGSMGQARRLYLRFVTDVFGYAFSLLGNREEAEDIVQDLFATICRRKKDFITRANPKTYLLVAARNLCVNALKRRQLSSAFAKNPPQNFYTAAPTTLDELLQEEALEKLNQAFQNLTPPQREVLVLHFHQNLGYEQIGQIVNVPAKTAQSRARLALQKLKELLS
ncbi:RNA polymerase sigma factor [Planctomycetota bacterium]